MLFVFAHFGMRITCAAPIKGATAVLSSHLPTLTTIPTVKTQHHGAVELDTDESKNQSAPAQEIPTYPIFKLAFRSSCGKPPAPSFPHTLL
jgi:hypothetical protein